MSEAGIFAASVAGAGIFLLYSLKEWILFHTALLRIVLTANMGRTGIFVLLSSQKGDLLLEETRRPSNKAQISILTVLL